jgi:large repetitive protein
MISRRIASTFVKRRLKLGKPAARARIVLFLLACVVAASCTNVSSAALVGLWRFNQNQFLAADHSGNGNHATKNGNAAWVFDGVRNSGVMSFDGNNDSLSAPDSASLSVTGDITLAAWVNVGNTIGGGSNWRGLLGKGSGSHPASYQFFFNQGNLVPVLLRGTGIPANTVISAGATVPNENTWEHWAMTQSGTAVTFYRNGNVVHNGTISTTMADDNSPLFIGNRGDSQLDWLGRLDDVAIFNEALSQSQIGDIRNGDYTEFGVPEPSTALLVVLATGLAGWVRRRP